MLPASLELAFPPYQSGVLPHEREERLVPAASSRTCISPGTNRRLCRLSYTGVVLAAGLEPATSPLRRACTAVVLGQHSKIDKWPRRLVSVSSSNERRWPISGCSQCQTAKRSITAHAHTPHRARASAEIGIWSLTGGVVGHFGPSACKAEGFWPAAG